MRWRDLVVGIAATIAVAILAMGLWIWLGGMGVGQP